MIECEWVAGLKNFMEARVTHEIFIALPLAQRMQVFDRIVDIAHEIEEEDDTRKEYLYDILSQSPYCLCMVLSKDNTLLPYIKRARGYFQESEFHYIIFRKEVDDYVAKLTELKDQQLIQVLRQYQAFNQTHFEIKLENAVKTALDTRNEDVEVFAKNPRFSHLNLHTSLKLEEKKVPKIFKRVDWTFPSLALLSKNSSLFNTLVKKYRPMMGMIFPVKEEKFEDETKREYCSSLQALVQYPNDLDILFNTLEYHSSLFTFREVYLIIKNTLAHGTPQELKILKSKTVKSWFNFIHEESRRKVSLYLIDLCS